VNFGEIIFSKNRVQFVREYSFSKYYSENGGNSPQKKH
jgi:hypothetical protein